MSEARASLAWGSFICCRLRGPRASLGIVAHLLKELADLQAGSVMAEFGST